MDGDFSTANFVRRMAEMGAPLDAITFALDAIEAMQRKDADRKAKRAEQKRRERGSSRDTEATVARHDGDTEATFGDKVSDTPRPPGSPLPSPGPQPTPLNPPTPDSRSVDAAFARFWQAYPKREGSNPRQPARERFGRSVKAGAAPEAIVAAAAAYRRQCEENEHIGTPYVAQAVTWLNQRRWEDYAIPDPPAEPDREYPAAAAMLADPEADIAELVRLRDTDGWEAADLFAQQHHRRTA